MMESGSDHKHIDSYSKPNSKISVWAYAMAALNMAGSRQYFGYSCEYARKAYQLNKYENDLTTEVYRTLIEIINNQSIFLLSYSWCVHVNCYNYSLLINNHDFN